MSKFENVVENVKKDIVNRYHNSCNNKVIASDLEEYSYQCLHCDEDLYEFETHVSSK